MQIKASVSIGLKTYIVSLDHANILYLLGNESPPLLDETDENKSIIRFLFDSEIGYAEYQENVLTIHMNRVDFDLFCRMLEEGVASSEEDIHIHMEPVFINSTEQVSDVVFELPTGTQCERKSNY